MSTVVTRYAPSPTGFQHIGGIRTALFAYLYAKQQGGNFILRIEDTDKNREVDGAIQHTIDALQWLGLEYQFGPDKPSPNFGACLQSDRLDVYRRYAERLIEKGLAYPDPYTAEEMATFREQAETERRPFLFRDHRPDAFATWDGTQPLRFKVPTIKRYTWHDAVRGEMSSGEEMLDDFVIMKTDGYPTYNFAHIVDDHEMGITHVMRGEEFLASMPKFLSLYEALEIPLPTFVTLPPIMGPDGKKKLSKRDGAKDLLEYRADGYLPEAMRNFLALIGWNPGGEQELFPGEELVEKFSLDRIQKSGGAFNEEKLKWMNHKYLDFHINTTKNPANNEYGLLYALNYIKNGLPERIKELNQYSNDRLLKLTPEIISRINNYVDLEAAAEAGEYDWAFAAPEVPPELLKWKNDESWENSLPRLKKAAELLQEADFSSSEGVKAALWPYAEEVGRGEVLWPLRVALTGRERSPDPFTCAWVLGKDETLTRIQKVTS